MAKEKSVKAKILFAALNLFLENGYEKTTMREIASKAEVNYGSLMFAFKNKESIVSELVGYVIDNQFEVVSEEMAGRKIDKILFYALETTLQLHIAESSEHLREMYNVSYSLPKSTQVVYKNLTKKLEYIFAEHLPELTSMDFYELEIASGGIMRSFLSTPCDVYFTMKRKVERFLQTTFLVYKVSEEKINEAIEFVKQFDLEKLAQKTLNRIPNYIESKI